MSNVGVLTQVQGAEEIGWFSHKTQEEGRRLKKNAVFTAWVMKFCKLVNVFDWGNITCQNEITR